MKLKFIALSALAAGALRMMANEYSEKLSAPWEIGGEAASSYIAGISREPGRRDTGLKYLQFNEGNAKSWATLSQTILAEKYRGQRIRFESLLKTRSVDAHWAGLWLSVETIERRAIFLYDSEEAPMLGDNEWQLRKVVVDIPKDAAFIRFGVLNGGHGRIWMDKLFFETVGSEVPLSPIKIPSKPDVKAIAKTPIL